MDGTYLIFALVWLYGGSQGVVHREVRVGVGLGKALRVTTLILTGKTALCVGIGWWGCSAILLLGAVGIINGEALGLSLIVGIVLPLLILSFGSIMQGAIDADNEIRRQREEGQVHHPLERRDD